MLLVAPWSVSLHLRACMRSGFAHRLGGGAVRLSLGYAQASLVLPFSLYMVTEIESIMIPVAIDFALGH